MNASRLRHRITIQKETITKNENGFNTTTWNDFIKAWADFKSGAGKEFYQAATTNNESTGRFIIRYVSGIDTDMRVMFKGHEFEIVSVTNDDMRNKSLTVHVKEVI